MSKEINSTSFANRLDYNVEEISLEEFLAVIGKTNQDENNESYIRSIKEKINSSSEAA